MNDTTKNRVGYLGILILVLLVYVLIALIVDTFFREGRIIAAALMTVKMGLFGTFTGFVASWFLDEKKEELNVSELEPKHNEYA